MSSICRPVVDTLSELRRKVSLVYQGLGIVVGIAVILSISELSGRWPRGTWLDKPGSEHSVRQLRTIRSTEYGKWWQGWIKGALIHATCNLILRSAYALLPEAGAPCVSSACWVMCGGAGQPAFLPRRNSLLPSACTFVTITSWFWSSCTEDLNLIDS
jgi:hypothetical protein